LVAGIVRQAIQLAGANAAYFDTEARCELRQTIAAGIVLQGVQTPRVATVCAQRFAHGL
jgi:hypothetical protein